MASHGTDYPISYTVWSIQNAGICVQSSEGAWLDAPPATDAMSFQRAGDEGALLAPTLVR